MSVIYTCDIDRHSLPVLSFYRNDVDGVVLWVQMAQRLVEGESTDERVAVSITPGGSRIRVVTAVQGGPVRGMSPTGKSPTPGGRSSSGAMSGGPPSPVPITPAAGSSRGSNRGQSQGVGPPGAGRERQGRSKNAAPVEVFQMDEVRRFRALLLGLLAMCWTLLNPSLCSGNC